MNTTGLHSPFHKSRGQGRPPVLLSTGDFGLRALLLAEVRVADEAKGIVEYVASDETIDSYREIIRVDGWRFDQFAKNSPFVDTHSYDTVEKQLGKVIDWRVDKRRRCLVETVQWAKDVKENRLAQLGWAMTVGGYLKAVSVGFNPIRYTSKWDSDRKPWLDQLNELGLREEDGVRAIYIEQQQIELSACILGANPNALQMTAKAYKAGVLDDDALNFLAEHSVEKTQTITRDPAARAAVPADARAARQQAREHWLRQFNKIVNSI